MGINHFFAGRNLPKKDFFVNKKIKRITHIILGASHSDFFDNPATEGRQSIH